MIFQEEMSDYKLFAELKEQAARKKTAGMTQASEPLGQLGLEG